MFQLLHSCGPLFKIIRVCGPQLAKNTYFCPKLRVFSKKKKGLQLESISEIPIFVPKSGCSLKKKKVSTGIDLGNSYFVAAACNQQDLFKIVPGATCDPRARS